MGTINGDASSTYFRGVVSFNCVGILDLLRDFVHKMI